MPTGFRFMAFSIPFGTQIYSVGSKTHYYDAFREW